MTNKETTQPEESVNKKELKRAVKIFGISFLALFLIFVCVILFFRFFILGF